MVNEWLTNEEQNYQQNIGIERVECEQNESRIAGFTEHKPPTSATRCPAESVKKKKVGVQCST